MKKTKILKMKQIAIGQYQPEVSPATFAVIGLDEDGTVYRYSHANEGWKKYQMKEVS